MPDSATSSRPGFRFNRHEWAGALGDIGTDFPLLVGMILASGLDAASVLIMFGVLQVATALVYRMPMPVQPLKAVAVLVISQKLSGDVIYGAGLAIGAVMLVLTVTRALDWLARVVPVTVVRGVQFGLGVQLVQLALREYIPGDGAAGYALAGTGFVVTVLLLGHRRVPAALALIALGIGYALWFQFDQVTALPPVTARLPQWHMPAWSDVATGFVLLALPQIPLSLGNSILATRQVAHDFFPDRPLSVGRVGLTYSLMNLVAPWLGGVPVCHGSGGMAGHYAFGGRTGGSVIIYGGLYLVLGLLFSTGFDAVVRVFPLPVLGVILLFEGLTLMTLVRGLADNRSDFVLALLIGLIAGGLPYGYLVAMVGGTALVFAVRSGWVRVNAD
jgi:hypothetical protein